MIELSKEIVRIFEEKDLCIFRTDDYIYNLEEIQLYLSAKKYLEKYG